MPIQSLQVISTARTFLRWQCLLHSAGVLVSPIPMQRKDFTGSRKDATAMPHGKSSDQGSTQPIWPYLVALSIVFYVVAQLPRAWFHGEPIRAASQDLVLHWFAPSWQADRLASAVESLGPAWARSLPEPKMATVPQQRSQPASEIAPAIAPTPSGPLLATLDGALRGGHATSASSSLPSADWTAPPRVPPIRNRAASNVPPSEEEAWSFPAPIPPVVIDRVLAEQGALVRTDSPAPASPPPITPDLTTPDVTTPDLTTIGPTVPVGVESQGLSTNLEIPDRAKQAADPASNASDIPFSAAVASERRPSLESQSLESPSLESPSLESLAWGPLVKLRESLQAGNRHESSWEAECDRLLAQLESRPFEPTPETRQILRQLAKHVAPYAELPVVPSLDLEQAQRRHALFRYATVWNLMLSDAIPDDGNTDTAVGGDPTREPLRLSVERVQAFLDQQQAGETWVGYLDLEQLARLEAPSVETHRLVRRVLRRMQSNRLTSQQVEWIERSPFRELASSLRAYNARHLTVSDVLLHVYAFELQPVPQHAQALAEIIDRLHLTQQSDLQRLGAGLEKLYCGPNVRLSVSETLINRLLPGVQWQTEAVREEVLGADVRGASQSSTHLRADVLPQREGIRILLEATGSVRSDTRAKKWPVILENLGHANYVAQKQIVLDSNGLRLEAANVGAHGSTRLKAITTEFDGVPLLGWMVRNLAREQHDEQRPALRHRMESRVTQQARQRMDQQLTEKTQQMRHKLDQLVLAPMHRLELEPQVHFLESTDDRIALSYRLAGPCQLGSHTVRPLALKGNLMSLQIHESVFNNVLSQVHLAGWQGELPALLDHLGMQLGTGQAGESRRAVLKQEFPQGISLALHRQNPVQVLCRNDHVELQIHFAKLRVEDREWRDFVVRGSYRPDLQKSNADLVRDGVIRLGGRRLGIRDQAALRAIFSKVLSKEDRWPIFAQAWLKRANDPRIQVNQFVVRDGWLGLSVGEGPVVPSEDKLPPVWVAKPPETPANASR